MTGKDIRIVAGFILPLDHPVTQNEMAWIEMLRAIMGIRDLTPTAASVHALSTALRKEGLI